MNGNGIIPTVDIGTGNNGWGGNMGEWILGIIALGMLGNGGLFGGGFGGANGEMAYMYPWIANGQQEIMTNTNNGFDTLHLSNQLEGNRDAINSLQLQLCGCCNDMQQTVSNGFYNAEIAAANRQMANMNQNFNNQIATLQGFNGLQKSLDNCCCENRLATCQTQNIVQNEGNATRFADANNTRDIITNATANTQAILDKLCQLELDAKNDKISDLERQNLMLNLDRSQTAQNAFIAQGFANEVDQLYNRLSSCPVPSTPVYGRTPIFTCNNNGCGCNGSSQFI
ncbi:MAG: hypothetical protein II625_08995 [Bacilli bacterium]|nr:hypothetical protein [Bacilli bacterium]